MQFPQVQRNVIKKIMSARKIYFFTCSHRCGIMFFIGSKNTVLPFLRGGLIDIFACILEVTLSIVSLEPRKYQNVFGQI